MSFGVYPGTPATYEFPHQQKKWVFIRTYCTLVVSYSWVSANKGAATTIRRMVRSKRLRLPLFAVFLAFIWEQSNLVSLHANKGVRKFATRLHASNLYPRVAENRRKKHIRGYNDKENDKKWTTLLCPYSNNFWGLYGEHPKLVSLHANKGSRKLAGKVNADDLCRKVPDNQRRRHVRGYNDKENDKKWNTLFRPYRSDSVVSMGTTKTCQQRRKTIR